MTHRILLRLCVCVFRGLHLVLIKMYPGELFFHRGQSFLLFVYVNIKSLTLFTLIMELRLESIKFNETALAGKKYGTFFMSQQNIMKKIYK